MPIVVGIGTGTSVGSGVVTYSGLLSSVGGWLNRSDLDDRIPDFIVLLEAELNRELRLTDMEETVTIPTDSGELDLPTDFLEARSVYLDTDPRQELSSVSLGTLRTKYADQTTGKPEVYAISGGSIILGPSPDDEYDLILTYYEKIPALTSSNETNWLIASHPDVYLWGTLAMAEAFVWNDPRVALWREAFANALDSLKGHGNRKRYGGPLRLRASVSE